MLDKMEPTDEIEHADATVDELVAEQAKENDRRAVVEQLGHGRPGHAERERQCRGFGRQRCTREQA
jgi:hypothetical protein